MNFKLVTVGDKEYKFRITNKSQIEIEKKIGPLLSALERATEGTVMATIVWGALIPLNHDVTLDKANDIIDEMVDEGIINSTEKRIDFITDILKDSGFFSQEDIEGMRKATEAKKKEVMQNIEA
ncbi:hypothetical protein IAI10_02040 [Clostridium sp. 19966]|uniref:hypothetical protein n=1 Tax=Clostridium sp. 19966 TaxID=2768166 RepID=UPI0028DD75D6|nr:hypothetical protein [Clostridium sp. 19966]MDT8715437.1 hypothetical protein [Clostridium sp. 19966]